MEKDGFYLKTRAVAESIGPAAQRIYDLLRTPGPTHPNDAAQLASNNFGVFKIAQQTILDLRLALEAEHRAARTPASPDPSPFSYRLDVLADLQNAMLWSLLGDDSATTNLSASLEVDFGYLSDRNITSVAAVADRMNEEPATFAFIADLATGVAIADIVVFTVTEEPRLSVTLLEVKEGEANQAILNIHELFERNDAEFQNALRTFAERYGKHGMKQLERFARQLERAKTYRQLITTGTAKDFVSDDRRFIQIVPPEESYAPVLNAILDDFYAHNRDYAFFPVDHLYFGFFKNDGGAPNRWRLDFQHSIHHDICGKPWETCCYGDSASKIPFEEEFRAYSTIAFADLRGTFQATFLRPLLLTGLDPKYVSELYEEALYIWMYPLDQVILAGLREAGLDVRLTRRGLGSRHERSMYRIDGKFVDVHLNDDHDAVVRLGAKPVLRTILSLQTLGSFVAQAKASKFDPSILGDN